jgi:hypothetical protein
VVPWRRTVGIMRRKRHRETKVWRDPLLSPTNGNGAAAEQAGDSRRHRKRAAPAKRSARIVEKPKGPRDPEQVERERLLDRLLVAEGRPSISSAVEAFLTAGFSLPHAQEVWLQVLEHNDESRVTEAIERLGAILDEEEPKRRKVLESRLRRIEEFADESSTQRAATDLRRVLNTRYAETLI